MVEIGYDILKIGIKFIINKWKEKELEIKERIDEYLHAAAKDNYIEHVEVVFIKPRLIELVDAISDLSKEKKNLGKIEEFCRKYIKLLKEICQKISYDHLSKVLSLKTDVDYEGYGKLKITNEYFDIVNIYLYFFEKSTENYLDLNRTHGLKTDKIIIENWEKKFEFIKKANKHLNKIPNIPQEIQDLFNALIYFNKGQLYYGQGCFLKYHEIMVRNKKRNFEKLTENIENSIGYLQKALYYLKLAENDLIGLYLQNCKSLIFWTNYELNSILANYFVNKSMIIASMAVNSNEIGERSKKRFRKEKSWVFSRDPPELTSNLTRFFIKIFMKDDISDEGVNRIYNLSHNHQWDDKTIEKYET